MSDLLGAVAEIRAKAPAYELAHGYYEGTVGELFTSEAVRRALKGSLGGFDVNLARRAVDAVLDRVHITAITVPGESDAGTRTLVDRVWKPNRMDRRSKTVHEGALVQGDAYLTVWDGDAEGTVEMHYNGPTTTRVFYDPENPQVKSHAAKLWSEGHGDAQRYRLNLYYPDRIERYITAPGKAGDELAEWQEYGEDGAEWPLANPHGEVPVFHFRTHEPYGRPEHRGAFGPQNAITKLSSTLMATVDYQGFPQRYALTKAGETTAASAFDDDEDPETTAETVAGGPGRLLELPGVDQVGQFEPANMDAFLMPLGFYVRAMAAATAKPMRFFDPQGAVPSGEALRADEAPLAARIRDVEELFTEEWQSALVFACKVLGLDLGTPDVTWAPVQTVDDLQGWQTVSAKVAAGVPAVQALTEAGYTSEVVEGWVAARGTTADTGPLDMVKAQAEALGALIRSGADPTSAASVVGLEGLTFTGAVPVTLRVPEADAAGLEQK